MLGGGLMEHPVSCVMENGDDRGTFMDGCEDLITVVFSFLRIANCSLSGFEYNSALAGYF